MAVRAALGLCLAALAWAGAARADNPACAQYREPMAYNACLAQHGPKANIGPSHAAPQPGRGAQPPRARSLPLAGRPPRHARARTHAHGVSGSVSDGLRAMSAAPEPAEIGRRRALLPAPWETSAGRAALHAKPQGAAARNWQLPPDSGAKAGRAN